jgi:lysophospholipase L1-like esterase
MKPITASIVLGLMLAAIATAAEGQGDRFTPVFEGGGIQVYLKMEFDEGENPFTAQGGAEAALSSRHAITGRSLHVRRKIPGGYFGGHTSQVAVRNTPQLNIAFCVRAEGMRNVAVNFYDAKRQDNTTPTSPARVQDGIWRTVVYAVEDFHHNSDLPQQKVVAETEHTGLLFHGPEQAGTTGQFWIDKLIIYRGKDTQPPEAPHDVEASPGGGGKVTLKWREPKDNAFPAVYGIYRKTPGKNWEKVAESVLTEYVDTVTTTGRYAYRVTAADYDNNVSKPSNEVTVSVSATGRAPEPAQQVQDRIVYAENVRRIHRAGQGKVRHDVFVFAGDSITAADAYTHRLGQWLARGIPVRRGVGTVRTDYGKNLIGQYLAESKPEFAVVMYGTNDSKSPEAVQQAMQNLEAVIDKCAAFGTVPILATIPPRGYDKAKQEGQIRFNRALIELCRAKKVPISYCFEEMMQRDLRQMLGDGVHLRPQEGNDAAGEALWKTMQQVYFALRDSPK